MHRLDEQIEDKLIEKYINEDSSQNNVSPHKKLVDLLHKESLQS